VSDLTVRKFSGLRVDYSGAHDDQHLVRLWLNRYAPAPGTTEDGRSATQRAYERDWKLFRSALDGEGVGGLQQVTVSHVYKALDTLGKSCSTETFRRRVFAIKSLFGFAHRTGYLHFNVASG
jgi:site-specific recombinase XerD